MALIKCRECGKDISSKAAACPQCGLPSEITAPVVIPAEPAQVEIEPLQVTDIDVSMKPFSPTAAQVGEMNRKNKKPWHSISTVVFVIATLLLVILFFVGIGASSLNHPLTALLPLCWGIVLWVGAFLLKGSAKKDKKGIGVKRQTIIAVALIGFSMVMLPVVRIVNASITESADTVDQAVAVSSTVTATLSTPNEIAWAIEPTDIGEFKYKLNAYDGEIVIEKYTGDDKKVWIASKYSIDGIEYNTQFYRNAVFALKSVTSVIVPEGVNFIENNTFNSTGIEYIYLPSTLEPLKGGHHLFKYARNVKGVYFGGTHEQWQYVTKDLDAESMKYIPVFCNAMILDNFADKGITGELYNLPYGEWKESSVQIEPIPQPVNVMDVDYIYMWDYWSDTEYLHKWVKITGQASSVWPNNDSFKFEDFDSYGWISIKTGEDIESKFNNGDIVTVIGYVDEKYSANMNIINATVEKASDKDIMKMDEYSTIRAVKAEEVAEQKRIDAQLARERFIESAESPSYDDLFRYPDKYKSIPIKITVYVKDANVDKLFGLLQGGYLCTINGQELAVYDNREIKEPRLRVGDTVTIYGYGGGLAKMQRKEKGLIFDKVVDEWYIPDVRIEYVVL